MKGRCTFITVYINSYTPTSLCTQQDVFVLFLSGVPEWRLMQVYIVTVGFSPVLYFERGPLP